MASNPPAASPRWMPYVNLVLAVIGTIALVGGLLLSFGGWRSHVDTKLDELDKRVTVTETTQRTNLPSFVRMQSDIAYIAERVREQEQRNREREHGR